MSAPQFMTPTEHEKLEWARMARAAASAGLATTAARFAFASTTPLGGKIPAATFYSLQADYRAWLIDNKFEE